MTTWNPSDKSASCTLSGGNLIATAAAGGQGCRNTLFRSIGKWYYEATMTNASAGSGSTACGVADSTYTFGNNGFASNICDWPQNGTVNSNGAGTSLTSLASGDVVGIAIDLDNKHIWYRKNGGNWNNDVIGNQNPVGNVGGINLAALGWSWTSLTPALILWGNTDSITGNFAGAFGTSAPSGFAAWDTVALPPHGFAGLIG